MGDDNGQTITMSQLFAEIHTCIREIKDEQREIKDDNREQAQRIGELTTQVQEMHTELRQLRDAEAERKATRREVWGVAMRALVTAAAAGAIGWMAMGFKQAMGN